MSPIAVLSGGRRVRRGSSIVLSHTFTGADSDTSPGNADTGQAPEPLDSTVWGRASNQLKYVSGGTANNRYIVWNAGIANGSAEIVFATIVSSMYFAFRCSDVNNLFIVSAEPAVTSWKLYRRETGTYTEIGAWAVTPADGDIARVRLAGSSIAVDINSVERITATDSFNIAATRYGVGQNLAEITRRWDTLRVAA